MLCSIMSNAELMSKKLMGAVAIISSYSVINRSDRTLDFEYSSLLFLWNGMIVEISL